MLELAHGNLNQSLVLHAFGPFAGLILALLIASAWMPQAGRESLTRGVARIEAGTGVTHLGIALFFAYWLVRLIAGHGAIGSLA